MSKDKKRRTLAVFFATVVGAALSLQLVAPATAAPPEPQLTPAAGDHITSRNMVFRAAQGVDSAGIQATIICLITVSNPHHSTNDAGTIRTARAIARVSCTAPVTRIGAAAVLFREGISDPVSQTIIRRDGVTGFTVPTETPCVRGTYVAVGVASIVPPPGFTPRVATIAAQSDFVFLTC